MNKCPKKASRPTLLKNRRWFLDIGANLAAIFFAFGADGGFAAAPNFRPTISWMPDQRVEPGGVVAPIAFGVDDAETPAAELTLSAATSNPTVLPLGNIVFGGSGANRTAAVTPAAGQSGLATVTVTVSDGDKTAAASFTLTVASTIGGDTPPVIQGVPGSVIPTGMDYGSFPLAVKDDESLETALTLSKASSNTTLVPLNKIVFGGQNYGRTVTVTPASGQTGRATITLSVSDGANTASTSFVLDVVASNTPPTLTDPANQVIALGDSAPIASLTVGDAETDPGDLRISAASSNAGLLPAGNILLDGTGANRTITLFPEPGVIGAATVNLAVSDGELTVRRPFLLAVHDPNAPAEQFQRPRGVFILDSPGSLDYTTAFGKRVSLRDGNIRNLPFVDGFTLRVEWPDVESSDTPGAYDFFIIQNALNNLPAGQKLSVILQEGSAPDYIAAAPGATTWVDESDVTNAVPWDPYLRERRRAMLQALANATIDGAPLSQHPRVMMLDPYLPGGYTGIRDPEGNPFRTLPGYTRAKLLAAIQDELRTLTDLFPDKFIQIGFWKFTDSENTAYGGLTAWEYVRQQLLAEFDGLTRPRIGFFMENLAAKRAGPAVDPYSATPATSYATPMSLSQDQAWNGFQMLGNWTRPFNDNHVNNTLNGAPADAMEFAFNTYGAEYHEVYITDIDNTAMRPGMTKWHEFYLTGATTIPPDVIPPGEVTDFVATTVN